MSTRIKLKQSKRACPVTEPVEVTGKAATRAFPVTEPVEVTGEGCNKSMPGD